MKNRTKWVTSVVILMLVMAITVTAVSADILTSGSFRIQRNTLNGAQAPGGVMSSASYQVEGAFGGMIGQTGGGAASALCSGYICESYTTIFLPLIIR
ncbi:MAG TPA: hypothetical protein VII97_14125 [Anaerolineales bacterium]